MKKTMLLLPWIVLGSAMIAQKDTTTLVLGKTRISIITEKSDTTSTRMVIIDSLNQKKFKKKKFNGRWGGIEIGLNGYLTSDRSFSLPDSINYLELNQVKSINFNLNLLEWNIGLYKNYIGIVSGLGLGYNNYQFDKNIHLNTDTTFLSYTIDSVNKYQKNKLVISNLRVPVIIEFHLPINDHRDNLYLGLGMIGSLRIGSHIKQVYFVEGHRQKNKEFHSYYLNPFAYSAQVRIGYNKLGFYFDYQLSELFKKNKGPILYPWAAGVSFYF